MKTIFMYEKNFVIFFPRIFKIIVKFILLSLQDYIKLQSKLVSLLEQQYRSDNISTGDENSRNWNNFFIQVNSTNLKKLKERKFSSIVFSPFYTITFYSIVSQGRLFKNLD